MALLLKRKRKSYSDVAEVPRKRKSYTAIAEVPSDVFRSIFNRLTFIDLVQAKGVCSSWNLLGQEFVSEMPWLLLPSKEEVEKGDGNYSNNNGYNRLLNVGENRVYSLKTIPKEFRESCCIGSSNGWLVFLGEKAVPFLLNPFKQEKIQLPSVGHLLGLLKMDRCVEDGGYNIEESTGYWGYRPKQQVRECYIRKAILTGEPENKNDGLILLCNKGKEIAYHERGCGDKYWTLLDVSHPPYQDIMFHGNRLYALSEYHNHIDVWDFEGGGSAGVRKQLDIVIPFPDKSVGKVNSLCITRSYLVESCEDILLVVRYIGEYVDWDGKLLHDPADSTADEDDDNNNQPKVCPYKTCLFHVYKLDFDELKLVEMESLGNRALFLGGNQSASVSFPNCENNSIYFTDDYWERMDEDYMYGGHDYGIYNLTDESVKPIYEFSSDKIQPPPCWIIPKS